MKKKIFITSIFLSLFIVCASVFLFSQNNSYSSGISGGCLNQPDRNTGLCVTDGTYYLCANNEGAHDCVKGAYLPPMP